MLIPLSVLGEEYVPATITHAFSGMADTNENGVVDSLEQYLTASGITIPAGYDPATSDLDGDGATDFFEWALGTDPLTANTAFGLSPNAFTNSSGGMTVEMQLPDWFGGYTEIYGCGSLMTGYWDVLADWIPTFGTNQLSWEDIARENDDTYFYTLFDATMDYDSDGLSDAMEHFITETDPEVFDERDFDQDGLQDYWESKLFRTFDQHGTNDYDGDGLLNQEELVYLAATNGGPAVVFYSDPTLYDTDGGGINDGFETLNPEYGFNPLDRTDDRADLDDDGLCNMDELLHGTELDNPDTDGDLVSDGAEVQWGTNPLVADNWDWDSDTDGDGMTLEVEYAARSNPFDAQSIGDTNSIVAVNVQLGSAADYYGYPYSLTLISQDHITQSLAESDYYQVSETKYLRIGETYRFQLERLTPENWVCTIREKSFIANLDAGGTNNVALIINDPNEVLGEHPDNELLDDVFEDEDAKGTVVAVAALTLSMSSNSVLTLKHDCERTLTITRAPTAPLFTDYEVEFQFDYTNRWYHLGDETNVNWSARWPSNFKLRAKAQADGKWIYSDTITATVQFPSHAEIYSDATVSNAMEAVWQQSLDACTTNSIREFGFTIYLNTVSNAYVIGETIMGQECDPSKPFSELPSIIPSFFFQPLYYRPWITGKKFIVADFHTHPPLTYAVGCGPRSTGPSDADLDACNSVMVPGFLYDYDADEVPPGHLKTDSASVIYYGPERRVLQDEEKL